MIVLQNVTPPLFKSPAGDGTARSIGVLGAGAAREAVQRRPPASDNRGDEP
jgi:hypothetical protein